MATTPEFQGTETYTYHNCPHHRRVAFENSIPPCNVFHYLAMSTAAKTNPHLQAMLDASLRGELSTVQQLITESQKASYSIPSQQMAIAATERARPDVLKLCFQNGAMPDRDILTALHREGDPPVEMLKAVIDGILIEPAEGSLKIDTLLFFSVGLGPQVVRYIVSRGGKIDQSLLSKVARDNDIATMKLMLELGGAKQLKNSGAMQIAAEYGPFEMVRFLVEEAGAIVDEIPLNDPGDFRECENGTALHRASKRGRKEIMKYLLEKGADPKLKDQRDRTPAEITKDNRLENEEEILALLEEYKG